MREPVGDVIDGGTVLWIDIIPGRPDESPAAGAIQFGKAGEQGVKMDVRHARIEQAAEALDEAEDFDLALIGPRHRAVDGGVQGGGIPAGRQDADAFHFAGSDPRARSIY